MDKRNEIQSNDTLDHSSKREFFEYYAHESESKETEQRFVAIQQVVMTALKQEGYSSSKKLEVADIGCGTGVQSILWASLGHQVFGLDVNKPLLDLAKKKVHDKGYNIIFELGSAENLPWENNSMDVCLVPEFLEHVVNWQRCLDEFSRIVRPGGVLYISTTNKLCPIQHEYNLHLYSWYPRFVKHRYERLAITTRPELVNHATYPAVNWFTSYSLANELNKRGFMWKDRFSLKDVSKSSMTKKWALKLLNSSSILKFFANVATPYTVICGIKRK